MLEALPCGERNACLNDKAWMPGVWAQKLKKRTGGVFSADPCIRDGERLARYARALASCVAADVRAIAAALLSEKARLARESREEG